MYVKKNWLRGEDLNFAGGLDGDSKMFDSGDGVFLRVSKAHHSRRALVGFRLAAKHLSFLLYNSLVYTIAVRRQIDSTSDCCLTLGHLHRY